MDFGHKNLDVTSKAGRLVLTEHPWRSKALRLIMVVARPVSAVAVTVKLLLLLVLLLLLLLLLLPTLFVAVSAVFAVAGVQLRP